MELVFSSILYTCSLLFCIMPSTTSFSGLFLLVWTNSQKLQKYFSPVNMIQTN